MASHVGEVSNFSRAKLFALFATVTLLCILIYFLEITRQKEFITSQRAETWAFAEKIDQNLVVALRGYEIRARGLTTAFELNRNIDQEQFLRLGQRFRMNDPAILNLAVLQDGVIELVFPFEENSHLVGRDIRNVEEQNVVIERIHRTGQTEIQGPVQLLQGGVGLIIRMPVFVGNAKEDSDSGRKIVSVIIDGEALLRDALHLAEGFQGSEHEQIVALVSVLDDANVVGDTEVFENAPVTTTLSIPGLQMTLGVVPRAGWNAGYVTPWATYFVLFLIAFIAVFLILLAIQQIAERVNAQKHLKTAIDNLTDGFVIFDSENRLVLCNQRYVEIHDKCAEAIKPGASFKDILRLGVERGQFPDAIGREEEWIAEQLKLPGEGNDFEVKFDKGRTLRIYENLTPSGGRVGLRIDITEQVQARERAETAERRLRDAINAMPAGFWLFGPDGRLAMYNDMYCNLYEKSAPAVRTGATSKEILEYGLARGEYPEAIGREVEWLQEVSDRIREGEYEWEYLLQNGKWIRSYNRLTSDGGRVGIRVDITELKRQQADLQASNVEMRHVLEQRDAAKKRFDDMAEITNDWFWEQDKDLRFTYFSEGFDRILGRSSKFALGLTREQLNEGSPEVRDSADWKWLAAKQMARASFKNFVYRLHSSEHNPTWVRISGTPIYDEQGEFAGYRGVGTDVSVLYNALREAEAASFTKTQFLNVISHELRTPLTVVLGYNAFLANPELLPSVKALNASVGAGNQSAKTALRYLTPIQDEIERYAGKIKVSGEQLLKLINDTLDLSRMDVGKFNIDAREIAVDSVIVSVVDQFAAAADQKSLKLTAETNGEIVFADSARLHQILTNLIGNALKFTEKGGILIRTEAFDGYITVHIEDSGCGIPEDKQSMIFKPFGQVDTSYTRSNDGTGLGLTISHRLVELQGGRLTLKSEVGVGSSFSFTLPTTATG
ncbi:PAS-domain containing protein [Roseovarius sp.]|uniref:sensor histidine kinase n=1 Tax=Roseovarius sp. TaxID=1486281 RepID=UPI003A97221C